ncbi:GL26167 [Drosophila persimilis]|uniref:GL26167 n=1 Tax=Drosophila persimilis TaxID=7234 RepID=B4GKU9_DROPE|nr:uncharacterized protein LOC6593822 [Drosophila persimilis]EDW37265.1 GL26167 [Drosophila persimilis]
MILIAVLPAILLLFSAHPIRGEQPVEPLKQLDELVTTKIRETLKKEANSSIDRLLEPYKKLQEAADWPFPKLDAKIRAYNSYKSYEDSSYSDSGESFTETSNAALRKGTKDAKIFTTKVKKILRSLGINDRFGNRVWQAIFSDEKNLMKLKKKLDAIKDSSDDDSDACKNLWDFILSFWF